jgi:solute carrier family 25 oxoglutarate transporter 11
LLGYNETGMLATCVVQPIDLLKNRMQLQGEGGAAKAHKSSLHAAVAIVKAEGLGGMYNGYDFIRCT